MKAFESVDVESPMNSSLFDITVKSKNEGSLDKPYQSGFNPKEIIGCIKVIGDDIGKFRHFLLQVLGQTNIFFLGKAI